MATEHIVSTTKSTPSGHVFVVRGKIGHLVADARIVSTDYDFKVEPYWFDVIGVRDKSEAAEHRPADWDQHGWGPSARRKSDGWWFLDVTGRKLDGQDQFARLTALLTRIADDGLKSGVEGRPLPLVVLPVIGTKGGGLSYCRGEVVRRLLDTCGSFVADHAVDIAIVAASPAAYGALQQRRRQTAIAYFPNEDLQAASWLGNRASNGSLALFLGAGTSVPAGAPSWDSLILKLIEKAGFEPALETSFHKLGAIDQAELLHQELPDTQLGESVASIIKPIKQPAIAHLLLAALNCESAVTTNYDKLYETAVKYGNDVVASVLPTDVPVPGRRWILKMHGDVEKPSSVVLTRSQFLDFTSGSGPAGAVLQSLLLTKHVLIVGTSMTDDNLLRLIHEVQAFRDRHRPKGAPLDEFGTILDVGNDLARQRLHERHFDWVGMAGDSLEARARNLEVFLDAVAMYAATDHSWLLDPEFGDLLDVSERALAQQARDLSSQLRDRAVPASPWEALAETLVAFGSPRPGSSVPSQAIDRARRIATDAHRGQVDKLGVPYIAHPAMVVSFVERLPQFATLDHLARQDLVVAAWLHDVVEDTPETSDSLHEAGVSARAIKLVTSMTRSTSVEEDAYYAAIRNDPLALLVKVADIASNLVPERVAQLKPELRLRLGEKYEHALKALGVDMEMITSLQSGRYSD